MKVVFLRDFRGRETAEQFYAEGQEVDFPDGMASRLIADGRVKAAAQPVLPKPGDSYLTSDAEPKTFTAKDEPKKRAKK